MSLNIDIGKILSLSDGQSEKIPLSIEIEGFQSADLLPKDKAGIKGFIKATKIKNKVLIEIAGNFQITAICSRCLKQIPFQDKFASEIVASFSPKEEELRIIGDKIDIYPHLSQSVILSLPTKVLCRDDCRGLCPVCGEDLNKKPCQCKKEILTNPFYKLKSLKSAQRRGKKKEINGRTKKEK